MPHGPGTSVDVVTTEIGSGQELIEGMAFDPWHALEAHRPLGNMMRARNAAYRLSTGERKALQEPDGSESLTVVHYLADNFQGQQRNSFEICNIPHADTCSLDAVGPGQCSPTCTRVESATTMG